MANVRVEPGKLGALIRATGKKMPGVIKRASRVAAHRGRAHLVRHSPVDQGQFKKWRVIETERGAVIENDAPHAGIIELGARPHGVNAEGRAALLEWVLRVVQPEGGEAEAKSIVWAICEKLKREGQKGTFLVRNNLANLTAWVAEEVSRQVKRAIEGPDRG